MVRISESGKEAAMNSSRKAEHWHKRFRIRVRAPSPALLVACVALLVALGGISYAAVRLPADSVGSRQVINHSLRMIDVKPGRLPADHANGWLVPNRDDLDCGDAIVLASHRIRVPVPSRVWTFFQETFRPEFGNDLEVGLSVDLLDAAGTTVLATSADVWENVGNTDEDFARPMASGGPLFGGEDPVAGTSTFVAQGRYRRQLVGSLSGDCGTGTGRPGFGYNQTSVYGFVLLGTA
jgi:hypothetical protein